MTKKTIVALAFGCLLALTSLPALFAQTAFLPVDQIKPGMKGVGRTVFEGVAIEEFQVEVLGVLKNASPKQDLILARLSGGPLERTGVIQGMSGSPVFVDGRLIGAVAFAFPFAKDPIAGIQPIGQMLSILDQQPAIVTPRPVAAGLNMSESPASFIHGMISRIQQGQSFAEVLFPSSSTAGLNAASLLRIQTPLYISGVSGSAVQQFAPFFNSFGFSPVQSGGSGSAQNVSAIPPRRLEPGSPVNAEMVRGDISVSANGTVTHVDGNKVYAFGHPFMSAGPMNLPMSTAYVIGVLPKVDVSFKLAVPMDVIGAFQQDRSTGIYGNMGDKPNMIPVSLTVRSSMNTVNQYNYEVANDKFLTPLLMNFSLFSAITASERNNGELTLDIVGKVHLKDLEPVNISSVFTSDANGPVIATISAVAPIQYLMMTGDQRAVIEKIDMEIVSTDRKTGATLERVTVDRNEVRPGDTVTLSAYLRGSAGEMFVERYPVQVPAGLPAGSVQLLVGDGATVTTSELRRPAAAASGAPKDLEAAIRELNKLRKNDRLYIKILSNQPGALISGEEFPSLPPSMSAVLNTDRASSRGISGTSTSTLSEYELPQSKYVIQGQGSLTLTVRP